MTLKIDALPYTKHVAQGGASISSVTVVLGLHDLLTGMGAKIIRRNADAAGRSRIKRPEWENLTIFVGFLHTDTDTLN